MGIPIESGHTNILFHTATGIPVTSKRVSYRNGCELNRTLYRPRKKLSVTTNFFKGLKNILSKLVR